MTKKDSIFLAEQSDRTERKIDTVAKILEPVSIVMLIMYTFWVIMEARWETLPLILFLWVAFISYMTTFNWGRALGWNQKKEGMMNYRLSDHELVARFKDKQLLTVPYSMIDDIQLFNGPLKNVTAIDRHGIYWFGKEGHSDEFPTLSVCSTTLDRGILIRYDQQWLLISPENREEFLYELAHRKEKI